MTRIRTMLVAALVTLIPAAAAPAATGSALIPESAAYRHGLTRAWFAQVQLDPTRGRMTSLVLDSGTLFATTDQAGLHAFDAETGNTLWSAFVGRPDHPSFEPAVNSKVVAVVNGAYLYVLHRVTGKALWEVKLDGAASGPAGLSEKRVFVPIIDGRLLAYTLEPELDRRERAAKASEAPSDATPEEIADRYRIEQVHNKPAMCVSKGHPLVQPIVTRQNAGEALVVWPTDEGLLYIGAVNRKEDSFTIRHMLRTGAGVAGRPTFGIPDPTVRRDTAIIYVASRNGSVHAIQDRDGELAWQFATGEPILEPAVVIQDRVYVTLQSAGMYCLDAATGEEIWWTPGIMQFVASGKDRLYATDHLRRLVVLDAKTGGRLDAIDAGATPIRLRNMESDRIYLATETGLVQCLHEVELVEPLSYRQTLPSDAAVEAGPLEPVDEPLDPFSGAPAAPVAPAGGLDDPFGGGEGNPFGAGDDDPFGSGADDPFGGGDDNPFE